MVSGKGTKFLLLHYCIIKQSLSINALSYIFRFCWETTDHIGCYGNLGDSETHKILMVRYGCKRAQHSH